ncbi:MAG TPA: 16S rRNA (cytosine(967)-C(5))-methyltransferase RsmB [Gemmatimonadaceae bacterium]|nr:16S rRNA (cytosine(967)-C(5))-methyltransferase RsmB [Gemmatimonadaceae bacterium]
MDSHPAAGQPRRGGAAVRGTDVTEPRRVAAELFADLRRGELLDPAFEIRVAPLDARDRRWTQELVFGTLRRRSVLDAHLSARVRGGLARLDPDLIDLLRLGAYQLLHMGSVPPYAAIAQTVELAKERHGIGASKLVNAVLRRLDRERDQLALQPPADPIDALAVTYSHPRWLVARWVGRWGAADTERLLAANNTEPPTVLRPYGVVCEQLEAMLEGTGVPVREVPLVRDSIELGSGVSLTELGAFRQGLFFVQDPGATLVTKYAAIPAGATVADLCAAPGGKALELARSARLVIAADRSAGRVQRMLQNFARVDARNLRAIVADARHPAIEPVDAVLVDVPCTGTGTFRRHPDARWRLKVSDLAVMGALQRSIIRAAAAVVRPGGLLIYSTCSLEPEENDAQVESFLAEHPGWTLEPPPEGAVPASVLDAGRLRVLPQRHGVDGAFAARLRRAA